MKKSIFIVFLILIADQVFKIWIKTHMTLGQEIHVAGNWFILHFTENEGMAFGFSFGGAAGKLILSIFRIIAVIAIGYYIYRLRHKSPHPGLVISFSLIMAGALGNIIDSAFYGLIFSESSYHTVATLFPPGGGYNSFLHGKVVDMLYFPVIDTILPEWVPFRGGEQFIFFRPVFNIADSSITTGVFLLLIFQKKFFTKHDSQTESTPTSTHM
ncbi:MAG: lipoprotein signal peptidase [Bacteroidales bacterium]|nr:lipoprotein signal peptidase [Bacteroidales bacterium]